MLPFKQFSALAGGLALGIMMIPIIARTTEELLLLVPGTMREGALALGATHARAVFTVVLPAALPGIITGIVLALARIAGETAPLLFTSFNNRFFTTKLTQPISSLTVQVFTYAISPYEDWHRQAWAGALVLVTIVLDCSLLARFATRKLATPRLAVTLPAERVSRRRVAHRCRDATVAHRLDPESSSSDSASSRLRSRSSSCRPSRARISASSVATRRG